MVRIRLRRIGSKRRPFYRILIADQRASMKGEFIEQVGTYNVLVDPPKIILNAERVKYWLGEGAQPTQTVRNILKTKGIVNG